MKKIVLFFFVLSIFVVSCDDSSGNNSNGPNDPPDDNKTGKVTFNNESSYDVIIHLDYFNGIVLDELPASSPAKTIDVRISNNYGSGTTFSIGYKTKIAGDDDLESGDVWAEFIDPSVQLSGVVKEKDPLIIQIPQPKNLEPRSAFIKIQNMFNQHFELRHLGSAFQQTTNGEYPVQPGYIGVYKLEGIPSAGKLYQDYSVVSTFRTVVIEDFTARNGYIYNYKYDGTTVTKKERWEESFIYK